MDPTAITIAMLTSPPAELAMIITLTELLKSALFWRDTEWRDHLVPLLGAVVGVCYGTFCGHINHQPLDIAGAVGGGMALAASGLYRPVVGPVVATVGKALGRNRPAPPPTPEA